MLQDKQIALDFLNSSKACIVDLTKSILESSNQNLKQTLLQMRNQAEQDHQEIYHIAERSGAYLPAAQADHQLVNRVNNFYQQMINNQSFQSGGGYGYTGYAGYTGMTTTNLNPGMAATGPSYSHVNPLEQGSPDYSHY